MGWFKEIPMTKLWGGRFSQGLAESAQQLSYGIDVDKRLFGYDLAVNTAHAQALVGAGILSQTEYETVATALAQLKEKETEILNSELPDEDIHSTVERLLTESLGDLGKKIHTGKSRNDQVATDVRLYMKEAIKALSVRLKSLQKALLGLAQANPDLIFPGFTHFQVAQPVLLAHHLLAYIEKLQRDEVRLKAVYEKADECPLGSAAMAGTNYDIDREAVAKALGFAKISQNSMDAVSSRDVMAELVYVCSSIMLHLSGFCEELVLFSSPVVGFVEIGDAFCTGSSIMPQKKNPDIAELIRGKTAQAMANLTGMQTLLKALPLTYNRDYQEDKNYLFSSIDTVGIALDCLAGLVPTLTYEKETIAQALNRGHILATELADYLAKKGLPFREAHHITGEVVKLADQQGKQIHELDLVELQAFSEHITAEITAVLSFEAAIASKEVVGATAFKEVKKQLQKWQGLLS